jgi:hypothetical protein
MAMAVWSAWLKRWGDDMPRLENVALGRNIDGHLEVLATSAVVGSEATVWHAWEDGDGNWTGWQPLGRPGQGRPVTVSVTPHVTDGRLEAFVGTERDQSLWHRWQTNPGTDNWSRWEFLAELDGPIEAGPSVMRLADERFMAVAVAGGRVWHGSQLQAGGEDWSAWSEFDMPNGARVFATGAAQITLEKPQLFALAESSVTSTLPVGLGGDLWHRWQTGPGSWSAWKPLGHPGHAAGLPVVAVNGDDRLEVFTIDGLTGRMWHRSQQAPDVPGAFSAWAPVGNHDPGIRGAAAECDSTGRMVLVAHTFGSDLWTTTETAPGSGTYAPWTKLADVPPIEHPGTTEGPLTSPALMSDGRDLMQFFVVSAPTKGAYQVGAAAADHWQPATGTTWPHP